MDDLIAEFLTETNESLTELDVDLVNLEQNPNDKGLLSKIFRVMHTIKGTCGFLGLPRLETVAHRAENVLGRFRDGDLEVTPDSVTLILESLDRIKMILSALEESGGEPEGDDSDLIARLDAVYEGQSASPAASAPPPAAPISDEGAPAEAAHDLPEEITPEVVADEHAEEEHIAVKAAAPAQKSDDGGAKESAVAAQSLRVNVDVLENLMTMVSELVLTRNQLLQISRSQKDNEFSVPLQRLNHVVSDLQEGVMKTRMQPIGNAWAKLPRIVRDISHELGKKIDLEMTGQDTELDRQVLDMIKDPLTHMVRNSADHGVERPADRIKAGKPETGKVRLSAFHEGGHIIIQISDDGKGLSTERIRRKVLENGLATEDEIAAMSIQQLQQFIFRAGFSTAEKVTSVSGRGVGMDVVKTNIERIGGSIELKSVEGQGSTFTIKIPLTLAIVSALIVEVAGERFAIPQLAVRELVMASAESEHRIEEINGAPVLRLRDHLLPLISLEQIMCLSRGSKGPDRAHQYIVVAEIGGSLLGIIVDRVFDTEEIVVKPVAHILRNIELFSGNTILGDGSVIMILDPGGIARSVGEGASAAEAVAAADVASEGFVMGESGEKTALLLFRAGTGAPKAVPLSLVSRLESVKMQDIEYAGDQLLVQYRGRLMPLLPFDDTVDLSQEQTDKPVLVFMDQDRSMGLIVDEISDIVEECIDVELGSGTAGIVGSAIIAGRATDIADVGHYLRSANKSWFQNHSNDPYEESVANRGRKRKVLLVDDSPFFRNMLTPLLSVAGYDVTTLENPMDALELCDAGAKFDVIVSDIEMPQMNGFEFAERVRSSQNWSETPMVALSSHANPKDINRGREAGFSQYVPKFDRDSLLTTLSQALAERH